MQNIVMARNTKGSEKTFEIYGYVQYIFLAAVIVSWGYYIHMPKLSKL